eukprot:6172405-Pleurochrysis_carterae.AAC.4
MPHSAISTARRLFNEETQTLKFHRDQNTLGIAYWVQCASATSPSRDSAPIQNDGGQPSQAGCARTARPAARRKPEARSMTRAIGSEEQLRSISGTGEASENSFAWRYEGGLVRYPRDVEPPSRQPQHNDRYAKAKVILGLPEISGPSVYRGALLEFFGTTLLVYAHIGLVRAAVAPFFVPSWAPLIVAVTNGALLTLFIIALAAPSGGCANPHT